MPLLCKGAVDEKSTSEKREESVDCCETIDKTDRMRLIVLVYDVQGSRTQPTRVGANSTGSIVVIDTSVSALVWREELRACFAKDGG